jgi:hypothetical protein
MKIMRNWRQLHKRSNLSDFPKEETMEFVEKRKHIYSDLNRIIFDLFKLLSCEEEEFI